MGNRIDDFLGWFKRPDGSWHDDDIWHHFPLFQGDWHEIHNKVEWYESPHIVDIYKDHKYIFKNIDMSRPWEKYYEESLGDGGFRSQMESECELPSGLGEMKIFTRIRTKTPPSGENDFGMVEYFVRTHVKYDIPNGVKSLPRFLAYPLNRFFKWAYITFIAEELIEHDGEFAREKMYSYLDYLRQYHGEEPVQARSRRTVYEPTEAERRFFMQIESTGKKITDLHQVIENILAALFKETVSRHDLTGLPGMIAYVTRAAKFSLILQEKRFLI